MKKKIISLAILTVLLSLLVVPTFVLAQIPDPVNLTKNNIVTVIGNLKGWVSGIVAVVGVIIIIFAAILYMLAGGDEEKTATAKKTLVGGVIGVALAVIAYGIFGLVSSFLK